MLKTVAIGLWGAIVALGSAYFMVSSGGGGASETATAVVAAAESGPIPGGLQYKKPPAITVPMISDGRLRGYVVAKIVYTADARALAAFPVDPQPFVLDEAFRKIYTDGKVEFDKMSKYNLDDLTKAIRESVNKRLGSELIHDVLVDEVNYVDKDSMKRAEAAATTN
ncbi:MAG TPA: hypothetical protein VFB16_06285 [Bauldia sp.]|nr:hypothetical protein [Bauldia sp.]